MKKFTILAGLMALALVIGVAGSSFRANKAEATPTDVISFNPNICVALTAADWTVDLNADTVVNTLDAIQGCSTLINQASLEALAAALDGDVDDPATYASLVDATAAQLGIDSANDAFGQTLWVLVFTSNHTTPVDLAADEGIWVTSANSDATIMPNLDDVAVNLLRGNAISATHIGDAAQVVATQQGEDVTMDYTIVGPPDDLALTATKTTIQEDSGADCDLADAADEVGLPDVTLLIATITDEGGNELTGIATDFESSDADSVDLAVPQSVSIVSDAGTAALDLGCGDQTGESTITAFVDEDDSIDDEIDITVVGAPASMTLAANPASITCNGTNSAEVTATLLDADGNPVVAGNEVRFEVVALGTANPIIAKTDASGVAKSAITPLSGVTAGVTVIVTAADGDLEDNILVACQPAVPTVVPTTPPTGPTVTPPVTGDAGLLP